MSERKALFDGWADTYDESFEDSAGLPFEGYEALLTEVVRGAGVGEGDSVLDVGTGTGALTARFTELDCRVLGIDLSEKMLGQARRNFPTLNLGSLTCSAL